MITNSDLPTHSDSPLCCLHVRGDDCLAFLQGQLTNDLSRLDQNTEDWQWSALCNPKGRAIATFIIWSENDTYWLLCLTDIAETVKKHLTKYILRSKVTITIHPCDVQTITEASANHSAALKSILITPGHQLLLTEQLDNNLNTKPHNDEFTHLWVDAQLPFIGLGLTEVLIPNHFDFEKNNGINYKKGCFTGQEVIARLHYLSQPQYGLFPIESDAPLIVGTVLFEPVNFRDQAIGHIMASYHDSDGSYYGFACIKIKATESSSKLVLADVDSTKMVNLINN